jgi:hypothetical protein
MTPLFSDSSSTRSGKIVLLQNLQHNHFWVGPTSINLCFFFNQTIIFVAAGEAHPQPHYQTVSKPGLAWRVGSIPGRPCGWIGSGLIKDWPEQQPGKTGRLGGSTHDTGKPGRDPMFFFFFKYGIWNPLVYIYSMFSRKKVMFFQCGINNFLV